MKMNLLTYKGRINKLEYLLVQVLLLVGGIVAFLLAFTQYGVISLLYLLVYYIINLMQTARRLHDINTSGWWSLLILIPIGQLLIIVLFFIKGTEGPNDFDHPKITP